MCGCGGAGGGGGGGGGGEPLPQTKVAHLIEDLEAIRADVAENSLRYEPVTNGDPDDPQLLFDDNGDVVFVLVPR